MVYSLVALSAASACLADAPPPLLRYIPVEAEGIEPEFACGDFKWRVEGPTLFGGGHECWELENGPWEFEKGPSCFTQFKRANLNSALVGDNHYDVLEAIYRLSNEEELYWTQGSPALTPISASAEKVGWLFYTPPADGYIALTQRLKMRSEADVTLAIRLNRGTNIGGLEGDRSTVGGGKAGVETLGEGFGIMSEHSIQEALSDPIENRASVLQPGVTWATQMVTTQLGVGFSFGTENGGHAEVGWQAGGDLAEQDITETMLCVGWDCVGGDGPWNKVYTQQANVFAKAGLLDGKFARVHSKVTLKDFSLSAMLLGDQCVQCALEPGYHNPVSQPPPQP
jgi:hypothetical protein